MPIIHRFRLWDIHSGVCLRVLEGHEELVRCIRFDDKRIVSGAYDGYVVFLRLPRTRFKCSVMRRAVMCNMCRLERFVFGIWKPLLILALRQARCVSARWWYVEFITGYCTASS